MFPKLNFAQLSEAVEKSHYFVQGMNTTDKDHSAKFPAIPPRISATTEMNAPPDPDENSTWFVVLSPRETRGTAGPFSIPELRRMYKSGEVTNTTLFWREGEVEWQQLMYQRILKPKLMQLPIIPAKIGSYNAELAVYDPVVKPPAADMLERAENLSGFDITKTCFKCGSMAVAHIPSATDMSPAPDLYKCREEGGTTDATSEILPGFLWVGSALGAKQRAVIQLGITMVFNCTTNMRGPAPAPPAYRCKEAPMRDSPKVSFTDVEKEEVLQLFEKLYDWIEVHRITPELAAKSDPTPKPYRGPTDKIGIPIKTANDKVLRRPKEDETPIYTPRVLLWSRLGTDRPCAAAAAYIIKQYHITLDHALHIVRAGRLQMAITAPYMEVLEMWARKYTLGLLICIDCQAIAPENIGQEDEAYIAEQAARAAEEAHDKRIKRFRDADGNLEESDDDRSEFSDELNSNQLIVAPKKSKDYEDELDAVYSTFTGLMQGHLSTMLKSKPQEYAILSNVESYLNKIPSHSVGIHDRLPYFRWSGLVDLELSGRHLSDVTMAVLFQLLAGNNMIKRIRMLKLQSNHMASLAPKALLIAYFPEGHAEDDAYYFDEIQSVSNVENGFDLMLLDLSNNK